MTYKDQVKVKCPECRHTYQMTKDFYRRFQEEYGSELYCPNCQYQKYYGDIHSE